MEPLALGTRLRLRGRWTWVTWFWRSVPQFSAFQQLTHLPSPWNKPEVSKRGYFHLRTLRHATAPCLHSLGRLAAILGVDCRDSVSAESSG